MSEPIAFATMRHRCPHCRRSYAHKTTATKHIGRCFVNPAVRGCKTCRHFVLSEEWAQTYDCDRGVDIDTPSCSTCGNPVHPSDECTCSPFDPMRKHLEGLRVQCDLWQAADAP